jgi:hypothetical protein
VTEHRGRAAGGGVSEGGRGVRDWQDEAVRVPVGDVHWRLRSLPVTGVDALEADSLDHVPSTICAP